MRDFEFRDDIHRHFVMGLSVSWLLYNEILDELGPGLNQKTCNNERKTQLVQASTDLFGPCTSKQTLEEF
jgi:hypothetical protein